MNLTDATVQQYVLRKWRVALQEMVSAQMASDLKFDVLEDHLYGCLLARLSSYVLSDHLVSDSYEASIYIPASWWHHFKRDCVPAWFKRRWPTCRLATVKVRPMRQTVHFERYATYPRANFPAHERLGDVVIFEQVTPMGWRTAKEDREL